MATEHTDGLLTPRESEVLDLIRIGLSNADIALRLEISVDGVKYHVSQIISKLGVRNRYEAAHWPERPPWWKAAFVPPMAFARRAALAGSAGLAPASRAAFLVMAVALVGGLGVLTFLLARSNDEPLEAPSWAEWAESAVPEPAFLAEPARLSGDGWSFESRVANLRELQLVALADELPTGVTLVDVYTGEAVANGTFGRNLDLSLRPQPLELVVLDVSPESQDRALIFDLTGAAPQLAAEIVLAQRPGYKSNVALTMRLSSNGRFALVPQRSWITSPECTASGGDAKLCAVWTVTSIDLEDRRVVRPVSLPERCYSVRLYDAGVELPIVQCDEHWFVYGLDELALVDWEAYAPFVDIRDDAPRIVLENGFVVDEDGAALGQLIPPKMAGPLRFTRGWPLDQRRALLALNPPPPSETIYTHLIVADLDAPAVVASIELPQGTVGVAVLDANRAVVLVHEGAGYQLHRLDLRSASWAGTVPVTGVPDGPFFLVR